MTRESDSGSRTPEGTDAFAPTTQLATFADDEAQWNNVIVVADATARNALSAPELRDNIIAVQESDDTIWLCTDASGPTWVKVFSAHNRQLDTANSLINSFTQSGIGKIIGAGTVSVTEAVTFPVAFSAVPTVIVNAIGVRATGAFNPVSLTSPAQSLIGSGQQPSTTGFTAYLYQATGGNLSAASDFYYSWLAIGAV